MQCKCCLSKEKLVKHHISYKKYGNDFDETIILCENCHNFLHRFVKGKDKDLKEMTTNFLKAKKWWKTNSSK